MWYGGWRVWVDGCTVVWVEGVVWWVDGCAIGGWVCYRWRDGTRGLCTTLHWTFTFLSPVPDNDTLVFINFRSDRMRQIVEALGIKPQFPTEGCVPQNLVRCVALCLPHTLNDLICVPQSIFTMTEYNKDFPFPILFPVKTPINTVAEWLSLKGLPQYHCAGGRGRREWEEEGRRTKGGKGWL